MLKTHYPVNSHSRDDRIELANKITRELANPEIPGILITGISGTGLRFFCKNLLGEKRQKNNQTFVNNGGNHFFVKNDTNGNQFRTYITVPMLPAHSLQDTLITTIQFVTEYAIDLIERYYSAGFITLNSRSRDKEIKETVKEYNQRKKAFQQAGTIIKKVRQIVTTKEEQAAGQRNDVQETRKNEIDSLLEQLSQLEGIQDFSLLRKLAIARARTDQNLSMAAMKEDSESNPDKFGGHGNGKGKFDLMFGGANLTASTHSEKGRVIANTISHSLSTTYHPYTTALATSTLIDIFNEMALFFKEMDSIAKEEADLTKQPSQLTLVLHLERYPSAHVGDILGILREITRSNTDRFHILATGGVDLYKAWKDSMQQPRSWLRSVFAKAYLLPPLMPWDLADVMLKEQGIADSGKRLKAYFGGGVINLTSNLMDGKDIKLVDYLTKTQSKGRQSGSAGEVGKELASLEMFKTFIDGIYYDAEPEKYFARVVFLYEILHEIESRWQDFLLDGKVNYYLLADGSSVKRHDERGLGEPGALLISECLTVVLPSFQKKIAGKEENSEARQLFGHIVTQSNDWTRDNI